MTTWKKQFKDEFGIHFKGCKGELGFAIQFIEDLNQSALAKQKEEILKAVEGTQATINNYLRRVHPSVLESEEERQIGLVFMDIREAIEKV